MDLETHIRQSLTDARDDLKTLLEDHAASDRLADLARRIADCFEAGGKVLLCGNGGSACDAMHAAEEFTGRYRDDRRPLPAIALTDPGHITCTANDYGFERVFSRAVEALGRPGDILIALSTSGNSENVLRAVEAASALGITTAAFLGKDGGRLRGRCDLEWIMPGGTADRIQELHMLSLHVLIEAVERLVVPENYRHTDARL
ncbi:MAG: SIS domain-containing protein [Phycisphaerales bacterium]|nr:SIS domain-containing protein [Phycisphaerales bacterium]